MNDQNKMFFFDFDGVICDSTNECLVTSFNAWSSFNNTNEFRCSINEFSLSEINLFKSYRPYVRGAGDYYILNKFISDKIENKFNEQFLKIYRQKWQSKIKIFKKQFFKQRKKLIDNNISNWINLHTFYSEVIIFLKKLIQKNKLNIITLKNYESVEILCRSKQLYLKRKQFYDESIISNKVEALNLYCKLNPIEEENIIIVDDNIFHLMDLKIKNYSIFLAAWFNTPKEYLSLAKTNNIPIIYDIKGFFDA